MGFTFNYQLKQSQAKEQQLVSTLSWMGYHTSTTQKEGEFSSYDVAAWVPGKESTTTATYEVKLDHLSITTGNVAVEVCKVIDGERKPSGLTASRATYQAYYFPGDETCYVINTSILALMVKNKEYTRVVHGGDGGHSVLCLFPKDYFISKCSRL